MRFRQVGTPHDELADQRSGELRAARELEDLGARLRHDAGRLATRYPAPPARIVAPAPMYSTAFGMAAVVALTLAATIVAVLSPMLSERWPAHSEPDRLVSAPESPGHSMEISIASNQARPARSGDVATSPPSSGAPSTDSTAEADSPNFLLEVSDPELEALLDLWEEERSEPTRLSI